MVLCSYYIPNRNRVVVKFYPPYRAFFCLIFCGVVEAEVVQQPVRYVKSELGAAGMAPQGGLSEGHLAVYDQLEQPWRLRALCIRQVKTQAVGCGFAF